MIVQIYEKNENVGEYLIYQTFDFNKYYIKKIFEINNKIIKLKEKFKTKINPFDNEIYEAIKSNDYKHVLDYLRFNLDGFDSLNLIKDKIFIIGKNLNGTPYNLPLSLMGDGYKTLIGYLIAIYRNNLILIDEIENSLHPGFIDVICRNIVHYSTKQLFISTHSLEFIKTFINIVKEKNITQSIEIIRLIKRNYGLNR